MNTAFHRPPLSRVLAALDATRAADFLAPLALRAYLAPVFWQAGWTKTQHFSDTVAWFEHGLELPLPAFMAFLATATELAGAVLLALGLGVRFISVPLFITMIVAAVTVHAQNGWLAIAESSGPFATERTQAAAERLARMKEILQTHGDYAWLTEHGSVVILNNGIEFAATYAIMLTCLFFMGGGRWVSLDDAIRRSIQARASGV